MENTPLEIKTNSELGSKDRIGLWLYDSEGKIAGNVILYFNSDKMLGTFVKCKYNEPFLYSYNGVYKNCPATEKVGQSSV